MTFMTPSTPHMVNTKQIHTSHDIVCVDSHVIPDRVREDDNTLLASLERACCLHCGGHSCSTGPPTEQSLLSDEPAGVHKGLLVLALEPSVHDRAIKHSRDEIIADTLHLQIESHENIVTYYREKTTTNTIV